MATENNAVLKELLGSVKYMIDTSIDGAPYDKTVTGLIVGGSSQPKHYMVTIKGRTYDLPCYISNKFKPNTPVSVMVPENNMDFAFIYGVLGGEDGSGTGTVENAKRAEYAVSAGYANTVAVATEVKVGGLLSSSGKNHVTVDPTGIATVTDVDHADNADNATNAVNATNSLNATNAQHAVSADRATVADTVDNVPVATDTKVGGIKSGIGIGVVNVADDGTATVELPPEPDPYKLPIATEAVLGGIYSSTGPGHVQVDENGIATVPDAGGIKEIPIATESEVGGVLSSQESGKLNVDENTGESTINDIVLIDKSGKFEKPDEWGDGPWKLICTEDSSLDVNNGLPTGGTTGQYLSKNSDTDYDVGWTSLEASNVPYDNTTSQMVAQNVQSAVDELNRRDNSISTQVATNTNNIASLTSQVNTNTNDITENAANIALHHTEIQQNATDIAKNTSDISTNTSDISSLKVKTTYYSNENILDNWYFANPINQKGLTQYPTTPSDANVYGIDRWILRETITYSLQPGYIRFFRNTQSYSPVFEQLPEFPTQYAGKTLTISILYRMAPGFVGHMNLGFSHWTSTDSDVNHVQNIPYSENWNVYSYTWTVPENITYFDFRAMQMLSTVPVGSLTSNYFDLVAAKAELGTQQTLAHKDENGNWVLNDPPPNYEQELAKCQRYMQVFGNKSGYDEIGHGMWYTGGGLYYFSIEIPLNVPMRAKPVATINRDVRFVYVVNNKVNTFAISHSDISSIFIEGYSNICNLGLGTNLTNFPTNFSLYFQVDSGNSTSNYIILDANL